MKNHFFINLFRLTNTLLFIFSSQNLFLHTFHHFSTTLFPTFLHIFISFLFSFQICFNQSNPFLQPLSFLILSAFIHFLLLFLLISVLCLHPSNTIIRIFLALVTTKFPALSQNFFLWSKILFHSQNTAASLCFFLSENISQFFQSVSAVAFSYTLCI